MRYWMLATAISMALAVGLAFYGRWAGNEQFELLRWVFTVLTLMLAAVWLYVQCRMGGLKIGAHLGPRSVLFLC